MIKHTSRSYSKWLVGGNSILSWGLMYYGVYQHEAMYTVPGGFTFLLGIGAYYMHIGHNDLKATMDAISSAGKPSPDFSTSPSEQPGDPNVPTN